MNRAKSDTEAEGKEMPSSQELAALLEELADLLEIKGEVPFKIKAYRRAADTVRNMGDPIFSDISPERLKSIQGIGGAIADKISQYAREGRITKLEELRKQVPKELMELMRVPSIGPRTAWKLFSDMGITSIEDLRAAAESREISGVKGLGKKSEEKILEGIAILKETGGRMSIDIAYKTASEIISQLEEKCAPEVIEFAGSLRRMKETVGDIDILAVGESKKLMETFIGLDFVKTVLLKGEKKTSVITKDNVQIDLRVFQADEFGAAMQYFTGSVNHNERIRHNAKKAGLKVNEYGVFRVSDGTKIAGPKEHEVYSALGMRMPVPEIREDRGEIEAAQDGTLPDLVRIGDIKGDMHVHTEWSDGVNRIEQIREVAQSLGYAYLAVTDHAGNLRVANGLDAERLKRQAEYIWNLNEKGDSPVMLLAGSELNIANDGELDFPKRVLEKLDFTIASIHTGFTQSRKEIMRRLRRAMENPMVKCIGHPTGRIIGQRKPYEVDMEELIRVAADTNTALELNAFPERLDLCDYHVRMAKEKGVKISIGTDAHRVYHLKHMVYGIGTARRGWLEREDVLNCMSLTELMRWLNE